MQCLLNYVPNPVFCFVAVAVVGMRWCLRNLLSVSLVMKDRVDLIMCLLMTHAPSLRNASVRPLNYIVWFSLFILFYC